MSLQGNGLPAGINSVQMYAMNATESRFVPLHATADNALVVAITFPPSVGPAVQVNSTPATGAAIPITDNALDTVAMLYAWTPGANQFVRMAGALNSGTVSMTESSLQTFAIEFIYDADAAGLGIAGGTSNIIDAYGPSGVAADSISFSLGYNGAQWDRLRTLPSDSDLQTPSQLGLLGMVARLQGYNVDTNSWDRLVCEGDDTDNLVPVALGRLSVVAHNALFNGAKWNRTRSASADTNSLAIKLGVQAVALVGNWTLTDAPAANTAATTTKAAGGAGIRHVITSVCADLNGVSGSTVVLTLVIRDGASGAGTILWQRRFNAIVATTQSVEISGLSIVGSDDTAMTVEFTAAPGATNFETISATGYSS